MLESDENIGIDKQKKLPEKLNSCINELQSLCEVTTPSGNSENKQVEAGRTSQYA